MSDRRIYLDNAATSFPKPPAVYEAMLRYGTQVGASPGRGHYAEAREGAAILRRCRERINEFIGGENPDQIVFTLNTSDALNLAIKGAVRARRLAAPGQPIHLITTAMDHNSVLRPFNALTSEPGVESTFVDCDPATGRIDPAAIEAAIRATTVLVAVVHSSNVGGVIQPIEAIGEICRRRGVLYLIDGAQSLGHVPFNAQQAKADLVAMPGHKGLLGPQGTGALYIRPGVEDRIATTREGGTGQQSELDIQPLDMPSRYEAGSHNTIGLAGLSEGVKFLLSRGHAALRAHELELIGLTLELLGSAGCRTHLDGAARASTSCAAAPLSGLRLLGPANPEDRTGVFSFTHDTLRPAEIAAALEQHFGVLARAGIHCAPRAHQTFGTLRGEQAGGAIRLSYGPFTTTEGVRTAINALAEICAESAAFHAPHTG